MATLIIKIIIQSYLIITQSSEKNKNTYNIFYLLNKKLVTKTNIKKLFNIPLKIWYKLGSFFVKKRNKSYHHNLGSRQAGVSS